MLLMLGEDSKIVRGALQLLLLLLLYPATMLPYTGVAGEMMYRPGPRGRLPVRENDGVWVPARVTCWIARARRTRSPAPADAAIKTGHCGTD